MNPNENDDLISQIVGEGLIQLIKKSADEVDKINEMSVHLQDIESDGKEKIIQLVDEFRDNVKSEIEIYREIVNLFVKLGSNYEEKLEIFKHIQEESDELFEQL